MWWNSLAMYISTNNLLFSCSRFLFLSHFLKFLCGLSYLYITLFIKWHVHIHCVLEYSCCPHCVLYIGSINDFWQLACNLFLKMYVGYTLCAIHGLHCIYAYINMYIYSILFEHQVVLSTHIICLLSILAIWQSNNYLHIADLINEVVIQAVLLCLHSVRFSVLVNQF